MHQPAPVLLQCPKGRYTASSLGRDGFPSGISCAEWFPLKRNCSSLMNAADSLRVLKSNVTNDLSCSQLFKRNAFYTGQSLEAHTNPHRTSPLPPAYLHKEDRALSACLESCQHVRAIRAVIRTEAAQTGLETERDSYSTWLFPLRICKTWSLHTGPPG